MNESFPSSDSFSSLSFELRLDPQQLYQVNSTPYLSVISLYLESELEKNENSQANVENIPNSNTV